MKLVSSHVWMCELGKLFHHMELFHWICPANRNPTFPVLVKKNFCLHVFCARSLQGHEVDVPAAPALYIFTHAHFHAYNACCLFDFGWLAISHFHPLIRLNLKKLLLRGKVYTSIPTSLDGCFTGAVQMADGHSNCRFAFVLLWFLFGCQMSCLAGGI